MDVLSIVRLVIRHWRVTAPALAFTLLAGIGVFKLSSPSYQATGSVTLLSPPAAPNDATGQPAPSVPDIGQNPYARSGDLAVMADILARVLNGESTRAEFAKQGVTGYTVIANQFQRGPVIDVTGQGATAEEAITSADNVLDQVDTILADLQEAVDADPDYLITSTPLERPTMATAMYGSTMRAAIAVLAVGTLGTLALAVIAEVVVRRRTIQLADSDVDGQRTATEPAPSNAEQFGRESVSSSAGAGSVQTTDASRRGAPPQTGLLKEVEAAIRDVTRRSPASPPRLPSSWPHPTQKPSKSTSTDNGHRRPASERSE